MMHNFIKNKNDIIKYKITIYLKIIIKKFVDIIAHLMYNVVNIMLEVGYVFNAKE